MPVITDPPAAPTASTYFRPDDPAEAREFDGFLALLPALRAAHPGRYVAVRGGRVVASGPFLDPVLKAARADGGTFYCGWVEPPGVEVVRVGGPGVP